MVGTEKIREAIDHHGMELLAFQQTAEWNSLDRFGVQKNIMITVSMTLIAAGIAAVAADSQILVLAGMLVPILIAVIRQHTIETLDRYYARFLEAAVVQRKLRFALGLGSDVDPPFSDDEFLEVARRGKNAPGIGSAVWIRDFLEKGHNEVVWRIFRVLCRASAMLPVAAAARLLTWRSDAVSNFNLTPGLIVVGVVASLGTLVFTYNKGTRDIIKKRDDSYGVLLKK